MYRAMISLKGPFKAAEFVVTCHLEYFFPVPVCTGVCMEVGLEVGL